MSIKIKWNRNVNLGLDQPPYGSDTEIVSFSENEVIDADIIGKYYDSDKVDIGFLDGSETLKVSPSLFTIV